MKTFTKKKLIALSVLGLATLTAASLGVSSYVADAAEGYTIGANTLQIQHGAAIRVGSDNANDPNGIGYQIYVDGTEYANILANTGAGKTYESVSYGVLIAPYSYHQNAKLNEENVFGANPVYDYATWNSSAQTWEYAGDKTRIINLSTTALSEDSETGNYYYKGYVVNIQDGENGTQNNLAREFYGVGYISYKLNGDSKTYYEFAEYENNHVSAAYVAQRELENAGTKLDATQLAWLQNNYVAKAPADSANTTYAVETYVGDGTKYILLGSSTENGTVGETATATPETGVSFTYNAEKSTASKKVYYNGKTTLQMYYDLVKYTTSTEYLVDVTKVSTVADLGSSENGNLSVTGKAFLESFEDEELTVELKNVVTQQSVTLTDVAAELTSVPYTRYEMTVKYKGFAVYVAPVDLYDSTESLVWNEGLGGEYVIKKADATTWGLGVDATGTTVMGAGSYFKYEQNQAGFWYAIRILAQHSKAYYNLEQFDKDATLLYDIGYTAGNGGTAVLRGYDGTNHNLTADSPKTTIAVKLSELLANFDELNSSTYAASGAKYLIMEIGGVADTTKAADGVTMYIGNFRLQEPVVSYTEPTEYLVNKDGVDAYDKLGSTVVADGNTVSGQAHLAQYANYVGEKKFTFANVVDTTKTYEITEISDLSTVPSARYELTIAIDGATLYTAPIDLYSEAEGFVWTDYSSTKYGSVTGPNNYGFKLETASEHLSGKFYMHGTNSGNSGWGSVSINPLHSAAYYEMFADKDFQYTIGFVSAATENLDTQSMSVKGYGQTAATKLMHLDTMTITMSMAEVLENLNFTMVSRTAASVTADSWTALGNFRVVNPVVAYTETAEYLLNKKEVTSFEKLGSTTTMGENTVTGQAYLASYAERQAEMSYVFTDAVASELSYTITDLAKLNEVPSARYTLNVQISGQTLYTAPIDLYDPDVFEWNDALHANYLSVGGGWSYTVNNSGTTVMGEGNYFQYTQNKTGMWYTVRVFAQHSLAYYQLFDENAVVEYDVGFSCKDEGTVEVKGYNEATVAITAAQVKTTCTLTVKDLVDNFAILNEAASVSGKYLLKDVGGSAGTTTAGMNFYIGNFRLKAN